MLLLLLWLWTGFSGSSWAADFEALRASCKHGVQSACAEFVKTAPVRGTAFWKHHSEPVSAAPEALVQFLEIDNRLDGFREVPVPAAVTPKSLALFKAALKEIPAPVSAALKDKLVGIFLVENLGSTGFNLDLFDGSSPSGSSLIVLDIEKIKEKVNQWATWKENTPFAWDPSVQLEVTVEDGRNNSIKNTILYILLHEMGHVLERAGSYTPTRYMRPEAAFLSRFPFLSISWLVEDNQYRSQFDLSFPERSSIRFYADSPEKRVPLAQAVNIYKALGNTSFPSLYAATNPNDDFAESFAGYIHSVIQKRPFRVLIKRNGKALFTLGSCWDQPRCKEKRAYFDRILGGSSKH